MSIHSQIFLDSCFWDISDSNFSHTPWVQWHPSHWPNTQACHTDFKRGIKSCPRQLQLQENRMFTNGCIQLQTWLLKILISPPKTWKLLKLSSPPWMETIITPSGPETLILSSGCYRTPNYLLTLQWQGRVRYDLCSLLCSAINALNNQSRRVQMAGCPNKQWGRIEKGYRNQVTTISFLWGKQFYNNGGFQHSRGEKTTQ